jgi:hypothetical protein
MPEDDTTLFFAIHFFNTTLNHWVKMKMDSIIKLTKLLQKLLFKAINITSYHQFNHHFHSAISCNPNPCVSLSQEHSYIKNTQVITHMRVLNTFNALLELSSEEELWNSHSMPLPQKCCHKTPTTQHNPALSFDFQSRQAHHSDSGTSRLPPSMICYLLLSCFR